MLRLLTALTLALAATPALARLRAELDGYRNLKFGMTPEQAQKAIGPARCWVAYREAEVTRCQRDTTFTVAGLPSSYDLHFLRGKLFWIVVEVRLPEGSPWPAYSDRYDVLREQLVAKHGKPDEEQGEVIVEINAPRRTARWRGPRQATELGVSASCSTGPPALNVAYADSVAMALFRAALAGER